MTKGIVTLRPWRKSDAQPNAYLVAIKNPNTNVTIYVRTYCMGEYTYTTDPLYARAFSLRTATGHKRTLELMMASD